jgi:hypothetical protein
MSSEASALVASKEGLPREAVKSKDKTADRIYKYYHSKSRVELTVEEHAIRERWEKAWFLLCRHRTQKEVVGMIEKLFNVGKSIAYDDVRNAMMLFGNPQLDMKDAKRAIAESMCLRGARKAWRDKDLDLYHKFLKEYRELNGLNEETTDETLVAMVKKFKPHQVVLVSSMKSLEEEAQKLQDELTQDIEHKIVE